MCAYIHRHKHTNSYTHTYIRAIFPVLMFYSHKTKPSTLCLHSVWLRAKLGCQNECRSCKNWPGPKLVLRKPHYHSCKLQQCATIPLLLRRCCAGLRFLRGVYAHAYIAHTFERCVYACVYYPYFWYVHTCMASYASLCAHFSKVRVHAIDITCIPVCALMSHTVCVRVSLKTAACVLHSARHSSP